MIRKSIFLGLTIVLGAVLASIVLKARREEAAKPPPAPAEFVRTAKTTATRVIAPRDLEISKSNVELMASDGGQADSAGRFALCRVEIHNLGRISYRDTVLKLTCRDRAGNILGGPAHSLPDVVEPGGILLLDDLKLEHLPEGAFRCSLRILHSDIVAEAAR